MTFSAIGQNRAIGTFKEGEMSKKVFWLIMVLVLLMVSSMTTALIQMNKANYLEQKLKTSHDDLRRDLASCRNSADELRENIINALKNPQTTKISVETDGSLRFRNEITLEGKIFKPGGRPPEDFFPTR